jgi:hypothetical protein
MLSARKALSTLCAKYELKYADLARHSAELGLDILGIDDHAQHIQEVCSLPADCHPTSAILPLVRLGGKGTYEQYSRWQFGVDMCSFVLLLGHDDHCPNSSGRSPEVRTTAGRLLIVIAACSYENW